MSYPFISIIVPTYNRPEFLPRALDSIKTQTFSDYEIIVVNDAGQDVQDIINNYSDVDIKYIQHENNKGLSAARNTGIEESTGEYICFLDDDDVIYPNHFETLVKAVKNGAMVAYTDYELWENDKVKKRIQSMPAYKKKNLHNQNLFAVMCIIVERSLFDGCMFDETLNTHEDWDCWLRLSDKVNFVHIPIVTSAYSRRGGQDQISNRDYHNVATLAIKNKYAGRRYKQASPPKVAHKRYNMPGKILLFMPTYELDGILQAWPDSIISFNDLEVPEGCEITRIIGNDNPYPSDDSSVKHKNTLHQYQMIRRKFLDEKYDYLVTFEHDMLVPKDGLIKLFNTDAQVVYGLYMLRHGAYCVNALFYTTASLNLNQSMTHRPIMYREADKQGWARVSGIGMGFTMFRRKVVELFDFRKSGSSFPPDGGIATDCMNAGIKQICRFDVKCGHINSNGVALYPGIAEEVGMIKVKILRSFVKGRKFIPGEITFISQDNADDWLRAGLVQILGEPNVPAVKIMQKPGSVKSELDVPAVKILRESDNKAKKSIKKAVK